MAYVKLAKIEDNQQFIDAAKSMGWEDTNYKEILDDVGDQDGYIVNYDCEVGKPRGEADEREVFFTVGGLEGNRWYSAGPVAVVVNDQGVWAKLSMLERICC